MHKITIANSVRPIKGSQNQTVYLVFNSVVSVLSTIDLNILLLTTELPRRFCQSAQSLCMNKNP